MGMYTRLSSGGLPILATVPTTLNSSPSISRVSLSSTGLPKITSWVSLDPITALLLSPGFSRLPVSILSPLIQEFF